MRKLLLSVVASCALVAIAPATALAKRHHHRSHVHHARVHHKRFGTAPTSTAPGTPTSGQTAGTVQSFTGGVLTILLSDGKTTVSGQVTTDTVIECGAPAQSAMQSHDQGDNGGGDHGDNNQGDDDQGQGDDENAGQACDSSALTAGAMVQEAELNISGAGAVWKKVELVSSSSSSGSSSGSDH